MITEDKVSPYQATLILDIADTPSIKRQSLIKSYTRSDIT